ncbi:MULTISPECIES: pyridoxine/pyridoxamine 5'-phosphate oxidase [unclassified Paenibacillus]|uniref:pyridoxine/pyridoxamine 5'-phosphate oxidase n=1 Tax=unclassified Paenibacillus TaxID=185978 RepID=UPI0036D2AD79
MLVENPQQLLRNLKTLSGPFPSFDINTLPENPGNLFMQWLSHAIDNEVKEPHAMTLSTVDADGFPDARVKNPKAALTFYWPTLGRQIRLQGTVRDMGDEAGAADFRHRSAEARAIALTGNQSRELASEEELEQSLAEQRERINRDPDIATRNWRLYAMDVKEAEFWQGDPGRKHTWIQYYRSGEQWKNRRLWP